jgi:predicted DNA-binding protein (MmcQ/YjbR family)
MDTERARAFLLALPHVVETMQWGNNLVFWVGDKAIGGKMFCLIDLDGGKHVVSFPAGVDRFHELLETDGLYPAPYFARIHWVAAERWDALRNSEWEELLRAAHRLTLPKLTAKARAVLELPKRQQDKLITEKRKALKAKRPQGRSVAS